MKFSYQEISSPLDQFEIRNLISLDAPLLANLHLSLTNIGLYLTAGAIIGLALNTLATKSNKSAKRANLLSFYLCIIYFYFSKQFNGHGSI